MDEFTTERNLSTEFESFWRPFTRIFQWLCVSHYLIFRPHLRDKFARTLPFLIYFISIATFHLTLLISSVLREFHPEHKDSETCLLELGQSKLIYYVNFLSITGSFVTHMTLHLEAFFGKNSEEKIFERLKIINEIFVTKFNHSTDYKARRAKYIRQNVGTFLLAITLAFASAFTALPNLTDEIEIHFMKPVYMIPTIIIRSRWCYFSIFLNAIADTLNDLQYLLNKLNKQHEQSSEEMDGEPQNFSPSEQIRYFRGIYTNVLRILMLISDSFGWSLITFLLEFSFEVIHASYWLYINFHFDGSSNLNIRKQVMILVDAFFMQAIWFRFIPDIILYNCSLLLMFWHFCMLSERCQNMVSAVICITFQMDDKKLILQGQAVAKALHVHSNFDDRTFDRFVRIFSLQMRKQPIKITMKHLFTFNYALLKSVSTILSS